MSYTVAWHEEAASGAVLIVATDDRPTLVVGTCHRMGQASEEDEEKHGLHVGTSDAYERNSVEGRIIRGIGTFQPNNRALRNA